MGTPQLMLRDMSDLDEICPSYITGEMSTDPILKWPKVTYYALCSIYIWGQKGNYTHDHYHGKVLSDHMTFSSLG